MAHAEPHPLSEQTTKIVLKTDHPRLGFAGTEHDGFEVEDWWDRLTGVSWQSPTLAANFSCTVYRVRIESDPESSIPTDDEVVYGKINGLGHLIHVSELAA